MQGYGSYIEDLEAIERDDELSKGMKTFCHFLEDDLRGGYPRCTAGVNFASVGPSRALCRVCPLSDLGNVPLCPNVEVYTFLSKDSIGAQVIDAEFECFADPALPAEECSPCCPYPEIIEAPTSVGLSILTLP